MNIIILFLILCLLALIFNLYVYFRIPYTSGQKGLPGNVGIRGDSGPIGKQGKPGIIGEKGEKGNKGLDRGIDGIIGEKGRKGSRGKYGIKGLDGLEGDKGEKGPRGVLGNKGIKGEQGKIGYDGSKISGGGYQYYTMPYTCEWIDGLKCPDNKAIVDLWGKLEDSNDITITKIHCCKFDIPSGDFFSKLIMEDESLNEYLDFLKKDK